MGFITQLNPKLISEASQLILDKHAMTGPLANGAHSNDAGIILYFISPSRGKHSLHLALMDFYSVNLRPTQTTASSFLMFQITHNDASELVGLLWTSDQLVAETST